MVVFLYRPARKAGRAFHTGFRFTVEFLYRPARKAGPVLKHIFKVNKMFLYRPARKAGRFECETPTCFISFYTDLPVRQVVASDSEIFEE